MKFSIIIVNYRTKELTENCINSIFINCKNSNFEIILVDNNSQDGSIEYLEKKFNNKIKIIKNKINFGFGKANNIGAEKAQGDYLFFLNSDTIINNNIFLILNFLKENQKIGLLAPKLLLENKKEQDQAYGCFPKFTDLILSKFIKSKNKKEKVFEVDWVSGACFFVKKSVFEKVNGFDEKFFMYFEDIDLSKRIKDLGFKNMVNKNFSIIHLKGQSIKENKTRKMYYYQSQDYYFKKHYGFLYLFLIKIIRFPYKLFKLKS